MMPAGVVQISNLHLSDLLVTYDLQLMTNY